MEPTRILIVEYSETEKYYVQAMHVAHSYASDESMNHATEMLLLHGSDYMTTYIQSYQYEYNQIINDMDALLDFLTGDMRKEEIIWYSVPQDDEE